MKHRPHQREKKILSAAGLLACVREEFEQIPNPRRERTLSQVIPLCPEPITKRDGSTKNDCERNAFSRFLIDLKKEHPRLKLTIVADALSATAPHLNDIKSFGHDFLVVVKQAGNKSLFEWIKGITREIRTTVGKNRYIFRYVNAVPLNATDNAPSINFLECEWIEIKGRREIKGYCAWATSHEITDMNVYEIMQGGRARWKVENETFNTLKNQGYQFEHSFGVRHEAVQGVA